MIQQYIILNDKEKETISAYKPEGVHSKILSVEKGKFLYAEYSVEGNSEKNARQLAEVDDCVRQHFQVTVIQNDSSAYFNNRLYPLVSEFERKLRKILYVYSSKDKENEASQNIKEIEKKDFGQLFTLLFIDDAFMAAVKDVIKNTNREYFSKSDILKLLENIEEKTVWDSLLGNDVVPTLRSSFQKIRSLRNDVMHSQDIGWNEYYEAKNILQKVLSEMDAALNDVSIAESIENRKPSFNQTLAGALRMQEQLSQIASTLIPHIEGMDKISSVASSIYANNPRIAEISEQMRQMSEAMRPSPEMLEMMDQVQNMSRTLYDSPRFRAAQEQAQQIAEMYRHNPELLEAQRQVAQISGMLQNSPGLMKAQEQAMKLSQAMTQGLSLSSDNDDDDEKETNNGGSEDGENENGIGGHDSAEHRED